MTGAVAFEDRSSNCLAWKVSDWIRKHPELTISNITFTTVALPHPEYNFLEAWHFAFASYDAVDSLLSPSETGEVVGEEE